MSDQPTMRPVAPLELKDVVVNPISGGMPVIELASPTSLLVDESYQRRLSRQSVKLIAGMVGSWDWRAFKPPTVVRVVGGLHVVDGQHTAIAAATRGDLPTIPVLRIDAATLEQRAGAFVRINHDRLTVTPLQLHHAKVIAGDEDAVTIDQVCARAGARIVRYASAGTQHRVGDIVAVDIVRKLIQRRFAIGARRVLQVGVEAKLAPIGRSVIMAIEALIFDAAKYDSPSDADIATHLRRPDIVRRSERAAADRGIPIWQAIAQTVANLSRQHHHG